MKFLSLIFLMSCSLLLNAQAKQELLIFNSSGNIVVIRGKNTIDKLSGERFLKKDVLKNIAGSVTIVSRNNKRITINEPGDYKYRDLSKRMKLAESSLTNRYFVFVWEKMSSKNDQTSVPGGVIRGRELKSSPSDNVLVLSDSIKFFVENESKVEYVLWISSNEIKNTEEYPIYNNLVLSINEINGGESGEYRWEIRIPSGKSSDLKCFIIPDMETKSRKLTECKQMLNEFSSFEVELRELLMTEYLKYNKLYLISTNF